MSVRDGRPVVRFALVGCGDIGILRAAAVARAPSCRLVVAADVDPARAGAAAARGGGAEITTDWRAAVTRPDVDAVIVSTPPSLHEQMTCAALESGKHVLCEKPLARTPEECRAMVGAAQRTGQRLATGFNYRFYPSFALARNLLDQGLIGELDHVRSYGGYSATSHNQPWVHDVDTVGGGALRDIGIHLLDLTRYFLGEVVDVTGAASGRVWQYPGCEDNGWALLRNAHGNIASVHASWTEWRRYQFRVEVYGTLGCIRATCFPMMTQVVWSAERGGRARRRTHLFPLTAVGEKLRSYRWVVTTSFIEELEAFVAYTRGEPSRIATGADGLRAVEIAAAASARDADPAPPAALGSAADDTMAVTIAPAATNAVERAPSPALSVVVLTFGSDGNPARCLEALAAQQQGGAVEVIVPHDSTLPTADAFRSRFPSIRFLASPGVRTPAELRARGAAASRGRVIAFLEAHAVPAPEWCRCVVEAHQAPHQAIGGPIEKGLAPGATDDSLLNWSVYLADYGRYMLPRPAAPSASLSDCNVSYKREVLEATRAHWAVEFHENVVHEHIQASGGTLWFEPEMVVLEQRTLDLGAALRDRLSFGRLFGSTRVARASVPRRVAMALMALAMPPVLVGRVARTVIARRRHRWRFVRCAPHVTLIATAWLVGEAIGYLTGTAGAELKPEPGRSSLEPA